MKKLLFIIILAACTLTACKKAEELVYDSHDNIYFDFYPDVLRDSVIFTFADKPSKGTDTVYLPVRISGIRNDKDRQFIIKVYPDSSTAVPGKHYKSFDSSYIMKAGQGAVYVPLTVYNSDTALRTRSVKLRFHLVASADFGVNFPKLIDGKVIISSKLERPSWWSQWLGSYYSQVKHELFIIVTGQTFMTTEGTDAPKNLFYVSQLTAFLQDPIKWVNKNPTKGYAITQRSDGNYDFYSIDNPGKKYLYRKNAQANVYYFIDENGQEIQ